EPQGGRGVVAAGLKVPEMPACARIERHDVAVAERREEHASRRREDAVGQRSAEDPEVPDRLARLRIDGPDSRRRTRLAWLRRRARAGRRVPAAMLEGLLERDRPGGV